MAALTADRNTKQTDGVDSAFGVKAATIVRGGGMAAIDATGFLVPAAAVVAHKVVGMATDVADNSTGANGAINCNVRRKVFRFGNSSAGDLIALTDINGSCYVVDDQTVAKTDGTGTRPRAGKIVNVDAYGVWVDFSA